MIKLFRSFIPIHLTPLFVKEKTDEFKQTGAPVWNIVWIKDGLRELSHGKCAYCECSLKTESNYLEVDHFEDKKNNPEKVLDWDNLLPSCKHCNGHKSTHDVIADPIINPFEDNPCAHIFLRLYRYKAKDNKGQTTIDTLQLNDEERNLVRNRFEIGNGLEELIDELKNKCSIYSKNMSVINRNRMISHLMKMLRQCQPESEYAALCATVLQSNSDYLQIKNDLKKWGLWNQEIELMDFASRRICLFE